MKTRLLALLVTLAGVAHADEPTATPPEVVAKAAPVVAKAAPRPTPQPKAAPAEPKLAPDAGLRIEAPTTRGPWTMRVTNGGAVPLRIVADARLLSLDVTPRSARTAIHCELPDDMRPTGDLERALVVPPNRSYAESFEPRLYCFGKGKTEALAPGAIVVARLGWAAGSKTEPPFEVSPLEAVQPELAPLKSLTAPPVALPDEPTAWSPTLVATIPGGARPDVPRLSLQSAPWVDAVWPNEIAIPITLRNESARVVIVRFRPEVLSFDVVGAGGVEHCAWPTVPAAPLREMFSTLAPKGSEALDVALSAYCAGHGLDRAGLLVARPRVDTTKASGAAVGLRTFDGEVVAATPTLIRLHRGAAPQPISPAPQLEAEVAGVQTPPRSTQP
jgi:hypothetical protein